MTDCPEILHRLRNNADPDILREAAQDAGDYECSDAVPELISFLESPNLGVQEAADLALRQLGGAETVQGLCPLLRIEDAQVRNLAMDILREIGSHDVGTIVHLLNDDDPDIRIFASDILGSTQNILAVPHLCRALLHDPEVNIRYQAAISLGNLAFPEAVKCLNLALQDEEWVQFAVIEALLKIRNESSIDALIKAMPQSSDLVASMIVDTLGEMANLKAVPLLLKRLENSPLALRNKIVKAVVQTMGGKTLTLLPTLEQVNFKECLLTALQDEDEEIQDAAISGLASLGVTEATAPIINIAKILDPNEDRHQDRLDQIAAALAEIRALEPLREALHSSNPAVLLLAIRTMRLISGPDISQNLMNAFWNLDRDAQRNVVDALMAVAGPEANDFFLDLLDKHADGHVLKQALSFLGRTKGHPRTTEKLFSFLEHPYPDVREVALESCIALGDDLLVDKFHRMFSSSSPTKRAMAVFALGSLGCEEHLELIRAALEDESTAVRKAAVAASIKLCGLTEEIFAMISRRLQDEDRDVRLTLVTLLGECVCSLVNVVPILKKALGDTDDWVKIRSVEALGRFRDAGAVPELTNLLRDQNKLVSIKVVEALGMIGGPLAFQTLLNLLNGDDPELALKGEEAIISLQGREEE